ncbi:MarR family winged helix-turn-helix transcriptional regulator [Streptomyces sp. NPDC088725]|uniref:MarR family winged helix-turn-helix transcriptional regulator n=1 Tax=Streptomyces sp. NPDC088725 TaxID=3365873 RepID=UPI00380DEA51
MNTGELDPRAQAAWRHYLLAYNRITRAMESEMAERAGLTLSQYDVLLRLSESTGGRMRMSDLAEAVVYSTGGLTRLLGRMHDSGLVRRAPSDEDRRVIYAELTGHGRARLLAASEVHLEGVTRHFAQHLRPEEAAPVAAFLGRLNGADHIGGHAWATETP